MSLSGKIGNYEIVEELGHGAMGEVYKATDTRMFGRTVALKILSERLSKNDQARTRFEREIEVVAKFNHPNIVTVYDWGEHEGRAYFVMEFIDGVSLSALLLDRDRLKFDDQVEIGRQLCDAVQYFHNHGVVHRDIKPPNIMITESGGQRHTKLVDFGIVHVAKSELTTAQTQPGTFSYMSPEQLSNEEVGTGSDLFSVGIVLYEMFTGRHPFDAPSDPLTVSLILKEDPVPMKQHLPALPGTLDNVVLKLLEKDPGQRTTAAAEVSKSLNEVLLRYQSQGVGTDPNLRDLDQVTQQMVENLVALARRKEAEGDLPGSVEAYRKAQLLAPDSSRIRDKIQKIEHRVASEKRLREHISRAREALTAGDLEAAWQCSEDAWVIDPDHPEVKSVREDIEAAKSEAGEDPDDAIGEQLREAQQAMDAGQYNQARQLLVEVRRSAPDNALATFLLDRLLEVQSNPDLDYPGYRQALSQAREAMQGGDLATAQERIARAGEIWPDDEEWKEFEREVGAERRGEAQALSSQISELVSRADDLSASGELSQALSLLDQADALLDKVSALGQDEKLTQNQREESARLRADLQHREEQRASERAARRETVQRHLSNAADLLEQGETLVKKGVAESLRARQSFEESLELVGRVLQEDPGDAQAQGLARRAEQGLAEVERRGHDLEEALGQAQQGIDAVDQGQQESAAS